MPAARGLLFDSDEYLTAAASRLGNTRVELPSSVDTSSGPSSWILLAAQRGLFCTPARLVLR